MAKKLGISARILSKDEFEDFGLSNAIRQGDSGEYVDTDDYLKELRNGNQN